jgi:hypothetical protein
MDASGKKHEAELGPLVKVPRTRTTHASRGATTSTQQEQKRLLAAGSHQTSLADHLRCGAATAPIPGTPKDATTLSRFLD